MQCDTCDHIDPNLSDRENARRLGIGKSSVGRHRRHAQRAAETDEFFTDVPVSHITSRGKSVRLIDGSWEKVTWQPNRAALEEALTYDDISALFDTPVTERTHHSETFGPAEVLNLTDLQIGKAMEDGGGTPETLAIVRQGIAEFKQDVTDLPQTPEAIILADGGDCIENIFNVTSQVFTNDLEVPAQIRTARRLFAEAIKETAGLAPRVVFGSVASNHGAFRTGYKTQGGTSDADFGIEINYSLEEQFEGREGYEHVEFVRPAPLEEGFVIEASNTRLYFAHGHQSGGVFKHGEWWGKQDHGRRTGWDADIAVFGHFHTFTQYQSGDGRWVIGVSSPDPGSGWYTKKTGESSIRALTTFGVQDGRIINPRLV